MQYEYVIENATFQDAGKYFCSAVNPGLVDGSHPWDQWSSSVVTIDARGKGVADIYVDTFHIKPLPDIG